MNRKYLVLGRFLRATAWVNDFLVENKIDIIYRMNRENAEKIVNKICSERRDCNKVILIDLDDWGSFADNKQIKTIMFNGKNFGVNVVITTTYPITLPPQYRVQFDHVVNLHDGPIPRNIERETLIFYKLINE
jgi:archaellum biogenesis ATPase FlaH